MHTRGLKTNVVRVGRQQGRLAVPLRVMLSFVVSLVMHLGGLAVGGRHRTLGHGRLDFYASGKQRLRRETNKPGTRAGSLHISNYNYNVF